jgi:hypothetical protein
MYRVFLLSYLSLYASCFRQSISGIRTHKNARPVHRMRMSIIIRESPWRVGAAMVFSISCRLNHILTSMMPRILASRPTCRVSTLSYSKANVAVDPASLELISGSTVDPTTGLIGSQFKIIDNSRPTSDRGCGMSFHVKNRSRLTD